MITRDIETKIGNMLVPGEPEERSRRSEECVREVLDTQIYSYPRSAPEQVRSLVDVGCNVGAFIRFARIWWPTLDQVTAYDPNVDALTIASRNEPGHIMYCAAVTIDPSPLFFEEMDWGGSRTYGQSKGVSATPLHPRDLPAADALKVDAEGVEVEVLSWYRHWDSLKIVAFEYHETRFRKSLMSLCESHGFVMRRGNPSIVEVDTQVWVRS